MFYAFGFILLSIDMYCRYFPAEIRIYIVEDTMPAFRESLNYINYILSYFYGFISRSHEEKKEG